MPIDPSRIKADIDAIAACTDTPGEGASRATFSESWRRARDYVIGQLESIGCNVKIDAAGNVHARPSAIAWESPAWISGSHIDSVPHGGDFDGVVGVVAPLEAMRAAREDLKTALPLELVIWAEEEGTTFGLGMLGSRTYIGELDVPKLKSIRNRAGEDYFEAGAAHGVREADIANPVERLNPRHYIGLIEAHVEQGAEMWNDDVRVAVVTAIAGRRQYRVTITGSANHAGSTQMKERRDSLVGVAEIIVGLERLAHELAHRSVITVGQVWPYPNALNVIAGKTLFTIDFRSPSNDVLIRGDSTIRQLIDATARQRSLEHEIEVTESQAVMEMDPQICAKLSRVSAVHLGGDELKQTSSGALHDAAILAPHVPTAMLFVASRDGISHNPDEFSRIDDVALAARILFDAVKDRRLE